MSDGFKEKRGVQENCQGKWKSQHDDDDDDDVSQLGSACETHQQAEAWAEAWAKELEGGGVD